MDSVTRITALIVVSFSSVLGTVAAEPASRPSHGPEATATSTPGELVDAAVDYALDNATESLSRLRELSQKDFSGMERVASRLLDPSDDQIAADIEMLSDMSPQIRESASRRLTVGGERVRPTLVSLLHSENEHLDLEQKHRLIGLIENAIPKYQSSVKRKAMPADRIAELIAAEYAKRWANDHERERFCLDRFAQLSKSPEDRIARLAFLVLSFDTVWPTIKSLAPKQRAQYLLLRISHHHVDDEEARELTAIPAADLVGVARATYWPVVVTTPRRDGAYLWTVLGAKVQGGIVERAIDISIDAGGDGDVPPIQWKNWVHFEPYDAVRIGNQRLPIQVTASGWVRTAGIGRVTYDSLRSAVGSSHLYLDDLLPRNSTERRR